MKKKYILTSGGIIVFLIAAALTLWFTVLKPCEHEWINATCAAPLTCSLCGQTAGEPLGHRWLQADCVKAKTCEACGLTEGKPLGHTWLDAACTAAKTCDVCGQTEGEPLGHAWLDATYDAPKTCEVCGETEGEPLQKPQYIYVGPNTSGDSDHSSTEKSKCLICGNSISRSDTNYCSSHDCSISGCPYPAKHSGNAYGSYCEFHGCHYSGCLNTPIGGSDYCASHKN